MCDWQRCGVVLDRMWHANTRHMWCRRRPAHAVYYAIYEEAKQAFGGNEDERHHPVATGAAGALATAAGDAVNLPLDVVKQRLQARFVARYLISSISTRSQPLSMRRQLKPAFCRPS